MANKEKTTPLPTYESEPVKENTASTTPDPKVLELKIKNLEDSYKVKCQEFDQLLAAYKNLFLKYNAAATTVKRLTEAHKLAIDLAFPKEGE